METKVCYTCGVEKPLDDYKKVGSKASPMRNCRACYVANRRNNKKNGVKYCQRTAALMDSYGLTIEQYDFILAAQGGKCAICLGDDPKAAKRANRFVVDHDHKTGRVRGLLCHACNRGLGNFQDDISNLSNAINYLNK